ncbi:MAG: ferrous iron transport protein B [Candidatus Bathyarchaeia archaeon]
MAKREATIALAGNANVGKSVIFNQLTGASQTIGNWPGKTVEKAEGTLFFMGRVLKVIDLPGIYSLSTFSMEEIIAREYIATGRPDVIVNVVDASSLERNLYFTLQLLEMEAPLIIALNQVDYASKKGIKIDAKRLSELLGVPVVPTVAITGEGIEELLRTVVDYLDGKIKVSRKVFKGREVERVLSKLSKAIASDLPEMAKTYPPRWIAIKLLEGDEDIEGRVRSYENGNRIIALAEVAREELENIHGEPSHVVIASERYGFANRIAKEVTQFAPAPKISMEERLSYITAHRIFGYPILLAVMVSIFWIVFVVGGYLSEIFDDLFEDLVIPFGKGIMGMILPEDIAELIANGVLAGIGAGVSIALPFIIPFYALLAVLEDSGYLPRAAFLTDNLMHKIGLHGKAFIPLLLGFGCSVPACLACRIMERDRERFLAAFTAILIPCAARTVVIMGLVGAHLGLLPALGLYAFDLALALSVGRLAYRALPGEPMGLIMEMPPYRIPSLRVIIKKTWARTKSFAYIAFPYIVAGSLALEALVVMGWLDPFADAMAPLVVCWLGLPREAGVTLLFGILRKELTLILLATLAGTANYAEILSPIQMIVFSLVAMIYFPCISTVAALVKEFGWRKALLTALFDIGLAMLLGGLAFRILHLLL